MSTARAVQTETALADGTVLVAGGCTVPGCDLGSPGSDTAETFDPTTGEFTNTGRMRGSRDDHVAVLLRDGRVLLAGGWGASAAGPLNTTELYDPKTRTFAPGPRLGVPRAAITAVLLRDGRVLLAGGFTQSKPTTAYAELFDPRTNRITRTGRMTAPRGGQSATLLRDGRVLVAGGMSNGHVGASADVYNPKTGRFTRTGPMRIARYKTAAVTLRDGNVLVIGGSADIDGTQLFASTELYDTKRGRFRAGPSMAYSRYKLTGSTVVLPSGNVLVAGGAIQAELYDARTKTFRLVPGRLDHTRLFLTAAAASRRPCAPRRRLRQGHHAHGRHLDLPLADAPRYARVVVCPSCATENQPSGEVLRRVRDARSRSPARPAGRANEPGERFCGECGAALAAPRGSAAGADARPPEPRERRLVSVLFADLVGFTTLSESRDAEEVRELLSRYFDTCRRLIELYGGTVEKFIGDAVMAVWGTPTATEDDAERAVRAALDLVAAVSALGEEVGARGSAGAGGRAHRRGRGHARRRGRGHGRRRPRQHRVARPVGRRARHGASSARRRAARPSRRSSTRTPARSS